jgi:hypothetical protein
MPTLLKVTLIALAGMLLALALTDSGLGKSGPAFVCRGQQATGVTHDQDRPYYRC